jgi:hypothetical protein
MVNIQIDLTHPGYEELGELLGAYSEGDTVLFESLEGVVRVSSPDAVSISVSGFDLEDYQIDLPDAAGYETPAEEEVVNEGAAQAAAPPALEAGPPTAYA